MTPKIDEKLFIEDFLIDNDAIYFQWTVIVFIVQKSSIIIFSFDIEWYLYHNFICLQFIVAAFPLSFERYEKKRTYEHSTRNRNYGKRENLEVYRKIVWESKSEHNLRPHDWKRRKISQRNRIVLTFCTIFFVFFLFIEWIGNLSNNLSLVKIKMARNGVFRMEKTEKSYWKNNCLVPSSFVRIRVISSSFIITFLLLFSYSTVQWQQNSCYARQLKR